MANKKITSLQNTIHHLENRVCKQELELTRQADYHRRCLHGQFSSQPDIKTRTLNIVENSLFSSTLSKPDEVIDSVEVNTVNAGEIKLITELVYTSDRSTIVNVAEYRKIKCCAKRYSDRRRMGDICKEYRIMKTLSPLVGVPYPIGVSMFDYSPVLLTTLHVIEDPTHGSMGLQTLAQFIAKVNKSVSIASLHDLLVKLGQLISAIHDKGVIHNNIKIENVLVESELTLKKDAVVDTPVLTGFRYACRPECATKITEKFAEEKVKDEYFAPEISLRTSTCSYESDYFSFGVLVIKSSHSFISSDQCTQSMKSLYKFAISCVYRMPSKRPSKEDFSKWIAC